MKIINSANIRAYNQRVRFWSFDPRILIPVPGLFFFQHPVFVALVVLWCVVIVYVEKRGYYFEMAMRKALSWVSVGVRRANPPWRR